MLVVMLTLQLVNLSETGGGHLYCHLGDGCSSGGARDVRTLDVDLFGHRHSRWYSHLRNHKWYYRPELESG